MVIFIFIINIFYFNFDFALAMIFRLLVLMDSFLLFFSTIHPDELAQALYKMKIPFPYAYTISLAARFVPNLAEEARKIQETQISRGIDFESGNIFTKIKNYLPLLIPLFVSSIRKAHVVAESLEARCFNAHVRRTFLHEIKLKRIDYILLFGFGTLFITGLVATLWLAPFIMTITQLIMLLMS